MMNLLCQRFSVSQARWRSNVSNTNNLETRRRFLLRVGLLPRFVGSARVAADTMMPSAME